MDKVKKFSIFVYQIMYPSIQKSHNLTVIDTGHDKLDLIFIASSYQKTRYAPVNVENKQFNHLLFECKILHKERTTFKKDCYTAWWNLAYRRCT